MKIAGIATLVLLLCAGSVQAQQLIVRSGDHPNFSRLTIPLSAGQTWEAEKTARGVEVTLQGHPDGFDTADIFSRMQSKRIKAVTALEGVLKLDVECDCPASVFRSGGLLVIDVADTVAALASTPLVESKETSIAATPSQTGKRVQSTLPWIGAISPFYTRLEAPDQSISDNSTSATGTIAERAALLQSVQQNLLEEVATAASVGLLENSYQIPDVPVADGDLPDTLATEALPLFPTLPGASGNMRITSSRDTPGGLSEYLINATASGISCPADAYLAVETWGDERGFSAQLGPARDALVNVRDRLNPDAAVELAKIYIYFGFGAEALDALRLDRTLINKHPELVAVAKILENGALSHENPLAPFTDCDSEVALWATLGFRTLPDETLIDTDAALRALNKLPRHLREILAPALSERFLQYGDSSAAAAAMRSVERLPGAMTPEGAMAQADIALDAGKPAQAILETVIESNSTQSPEALVKLVEAKLAKDQPLPYEMATLVEAYAQELRGTQMGTRLRQTQVIALSQSARFDEAFETLDDIRPSLSVATGSALQGTVLEQLAKRADNIEFLEALFDQSQTSIEILDAKVKLALAERLMNLGFAAQVQTMLASVPDRPRNAARQLLAARAAIALQQPFQAQAALIGLDDPRAADLLAQSKEMTGAYAEAAEIFSQNDNETAAAQANWLSDDWRASTAANTPTFGPVATLAGADPAADQTEVGPLSRADRAVQESRAARETIEQLLSDPQVQISPES